MAGRKVLVVVTTEAGEAELPDELTGTDEIRVVTPAAQVSTSPG